MAKFSRFMMTDSYHWHQLGPNHYHLYDHGGGFDSRFRNPYLDSIMDSDCTVLTEYIHIPNDSSYGNLKFVFDFETKKRYLGSLATYNQHPDLSFQNFVCSFNRGAHVSRKFLTAILNRFGWFDKKYSSKNFSYSADTIDGQLFDYVQHDVALYRKFFIANETDDFFITENSFGNHHDDKSLNIYYLDHKLTKSFLQLVSESLATSYLPFVTEKFLYSVVTRGLFLAYAQPGWHDHLERYYGFRKYDKIFDYRFDTIQNPVERLIELISMIAKFSVLSSDDWRDLNGMEIDTLEYNYDHYFSKNYLKHLEQFS